MKTIKHRYQVLEKINESPNCFTLHKGFDKKKERNVTIKIFSDVRQNKVAKQLYKREKEFYNIIYTAKLKGFPVFYANGTYKKENKFIVISRHGYDLHTIHKICAHKFSYKTVLNIGIEILDRLEKIHSFGFIYNNISPQSILIPLISDLDQGTLTLTEFQKCRKFEALPELIVEIFQSKFDDLESLFFMLAFLVKGFLPWGRHGEDIFKKEIRLKVKNQQLQDYFIDLDSDFLKYYKQLKDIERSFKRATDDKRSVHNPIDEQVSKIDYSKFKTILFEALYKHQSDKPYRFDWFPILTKIQRFNRKTGQGTNSQNGSIAESQSRSKSGSHFNKKDNTKINKTASLIQSQYESYKMKSLTPEGLLEIKTLQLKPQQESSDFGGNLKRPQFMEIHIQSLENEPLQQESVNVFAFKYPSQPQNLIPLVYSRERSRSVNVEEQKDNKKSNKQLEQIPSVSESKQQEEEVKEDNLLYHSPSFSNSDMDKFSQEPPSPLLDYPLISDNHRDSLSAQLRPKNNEGKLQHRPSSKKQNPLKSLNMAFKGQNLLSPQKVEQSSSSSDDDDDDEDAECDEEGKQGQASNQEAGEESKEDEKDQSNDNSMIYSSGQESQRIMKSSQVVNYEEIR